MNRNIFKHENIILKKYGILKGFIRIVLDIHIFPDMFSPSMLLTTLIVVVLIALTVITILVFIKRKKNGEKQNQAKLRRKAMVHFTFVNYSIIRIQLLKL